MLIETKNLCCKAGRRYLLNNINWQVEEGEHWLIFGMNGSGKTTLLSTIAGLKPVSSGTLEVLGHSYTRENIFALRRQVGMVSSSLFDQIYHNELALQIVLSGLFGSFDVGNGLRDADVRRAKSILRELRMGDKIYRAFDTLSKGERQNVLIARALISQPRILVLDEPCSGLDLYAQEHFARSVQALADSGTVTILYVTHHLEEFPSFVTNALLMRHGQVLAQGTIDEMMQSQYISALLNEDVKVRRNDRGQYQMSVVAISRMYDLCYRDEKRTVVSRDAEC